VLAEISRQGLTLEAILVTHHHPDHVGGIEALLTHRQVPVYGPADEDIPARSVAVRDGDCVELPTLGLRFAVTAVPGHTAGHVAYQGHGVLFPGDTLFSAGCGRLFEGTPAQMLASLDQLARLPADTRVYPAHEYTASNVAFALAVEPGNEALRQYAADVTALRAADNATLPTTIGRELAVNPFLRTRTAPVRAAAERHAGRPLKRDDETFAAVREWKNGFRA
jgi:hydroxyacylglutathione hydrolase